METPLVTLMLQRAAQAIEEAIMPNITEPFALEEAKHIAFMMRSLAPNVEEKSQDLKEENESMRRVLGRVVTLLRRRNTSSLNTTRTGLIELVEYELTKVDAEPLNVSQENHNLKRALVETIKSLDALTGDVPIQTMPSLRRQIRSVLRQQLNNTAARRLTMWSFLESPAETSE